jgi:hypothetical protein
MQIDGHPPAYAIERKLPDRELKYTDDETDSLLSDEIGVFEERAEKDSFKNDGMRRGWQTQRDRDERTDNVPSDEEVYGDDYRDGWE